MFDFDIIGDNAPVTVKVNSYQGTITTLRDGKIFTMANNPSILFNFTDQGKSESVIDLAEPYFMGLLREFRDDDIDLTIKGNLFEQEFYKIVAHNNQFHDLKCAYNDFVLATSARLSAFAKMKAAFPVKVVPIELSFYGDDFYHFELPSYSLVNFAGGAGTSRIFISSNLSYLERGLRARGADNIAFLVGGSSQALDDGKYIIGCTADNVHSMVTSYIETRYINPFIGELFNTIASIENFPIDKMVRTLNRVDPYYYCKKESLEIYENDLTAVDVHCFSTDNMGRIQTDSPEWLEKVRLKTILPNACVVVKNQGVYLKFPTSGNDRVSLYMDGLDFTASIDVEVKQHIYVTNVDLNMDVTKWKQGNYYPFRVGIIPQHAEDRREIVIESSDPHIAEVRGDQVYVKNEGSFHLVARIRDREWSKRFIVRFPHVDSFDTKDWPERNSMTVGGEWETPLLINGRIARCNEYEIICTDANGQNRKVDISTGTTNVYIKARKAGDVSIKFVPKDDESQSLIKKLKIKKADREWFFTGFAICGLILSIVLTLFRSAWAPGFYLATGLLFIVAALRRESYAKPLTAIALVILLGLSWLHENILCVRRYVMSGSEISESVFNQILDESRTYVLKEKYEFSEQMMAIETTDYYATSADYLGYYFTEGKSGIFHLGKPHNYLHLVYRVVATSPEDRTSKTFFIVDEITDVRDIGKGEFTYKNKKGVLGFDSFEGLLKDIPHDGESTVSQNMVYGELGFGQYLYDVSQVSQETIDAIVETILSDFDSSAGDTASANYSDVYFYDALLVSGREQASNVYSRVQNRLYIFLACDESQNGEHLRSFYYPYYFDNIMLNDAGVAEIDVQSAKKADPTMDIVSYITDIKGDFGASYEYVHFNG